MEVTTIIMLALALATFRIAEYLLIRLVDGIATVVAAWYCWRSARLTQALSVASGPSNPIGPLLAWNVSRAHRRLVARHLRLAMAMTAHFSLFPRSSERGYALMRAYGYINA